MVSVQNRQRLNFVHADQDHRAETRIVLMEMLPMDEIFCRKGWSTSC